MADGPNPLDQLTERLRALEQRHGEFGKEIERLKAEINRLQIDSIFDDLEVPAPPATGAEVPPPVAETPPAAETPVPPATPQPEPEKVRQPVFANQTADQKSRQDFISQFSADIPPEKEKPKKEKSNIERFIGQNVISIIGVVITVIGVGVGAKYAIDNDLISPLTRIILGYIMGAGLMAVALKLKAKYEKFSAVLLSGSIAILYFITFAAYDFYELIPQALAFGLMVLFTGFTVAAALNYDRQVIAHIGLVGAYGVPFLLSDGSGKVAVLFTYMAIINIGILIISVKKLWKPLYYSAFGLSWLIFGGWFGAAYEMEDHFSLALIFLSVFFVIFYATFLAYKLFKNEKFRIDDIVLLVANSFVFFGLGYGILQEHESGAQLLGLFTLINAVIHFGVTVTVYKRELADRNLFFLLAGMVLVFITIAVPVQLEGSWVTLIWAGEAALLFWIGRTNKVPGYEYLSYPLILLAFGSIIHDWGEMPQYYDDGSGTRLASFGNIYFLTGLMVSAAFAFIQWFFHNKKFENPLDEKKLFFAPIVQVLLPATLIIVAYFTFAIEIWRFWENTYVESAVEVLGDDGEFAYTTHNYDLRNFQWIWILNYTMLFMTVLGLLNNFWFKNKMLGRVNLIANMWTLLGFLAGGLFLFSELRDAYLNPITDAPIERGMMYLAIRYISLPFVAGLLYSCYLYVKSEFIELKLIHPFEFVLHVTILWLLSAELIHWMDMFRSEQPYRLGLSILWGVYSFVLIAIGIARKNKFLRFGAIGLFAVTLLKLFAYDLSDLSTIGKTIVLVILGLLLLGISFLYTKYKHLIFEPEEKKEEVSDGE